MVQKKKGRDDLEASAARDSIYMSSGLEDRIDPEELGIVDDAGDEIPFWEGAQRPVLGCILYYESPSSGVRCELLSVSTSDAGFAVRCLVNLQDAKEVLSCPDFIRIVVTMGEDAIMEKDLLDPHRQVRTLEVTEIGLVLSVSSVESDS